MSFVEDAKLLQVELRNLRRELHREPELGLELPRTQARVLAALAGTDLDITLGTTSSSITAVLRGPHDGPVVLLRGDMDGLPVTEETNLGYAAKTGTMHACGHDLHTAALVGAAKLLAARRSQLPGTVVFMFQPGEETCTGAAAMIAEGVLGAAGRTVDAAYGIHVTPGEPGVFSLKPGPTMAGSHNLTVTIEGHGGHGSMPMFARNPVPVIGALVGELQSLVISRFSPFEPLVITPTQLRGSDAPNVIPSSASLGCTVRTFTPDAVERLRAEITALSNGLAAAHGCTAVVELETIAPVTVNDATEAAAAHDVLSAAFGSSRVHLLADPVPGSEDFALVLEKVPGAFLFLAASPAGLDNPAYNHSPQVLFNDDVLADQAAALAELAWARLARG
ncbi:M20 metallopeptidase family protein [Arthrobacter sp. HLT1-20]